MNGEARQLVRTVRSDLAKARAAQLILVEGADSCDYCGVVIAPRVPNKRFCGTRCRKSFWNFKTYRGKRYRLDAKRRLRARQAA